MAYYTNASYLYNKTNTSYQQTTTAQINVQFSSQMLQNVT